MKHIKAFIGKYLLSIVVCLETIVLFLIIIIPTEYLLTEKYLICTYVDSRTKTIIFLAILIILYLLNYFWKSFADIGKHLFLPLCLFTLAAIIGNRYYLQYYSYLQQFPRIYSISSNWAIQGMPITITGKNFGPTWNPGTVKIGNLDFVQIEYWSDEKIIVTTPVPNKFSDTYLFVVNFAGQESNKVDFEIRNPDKLLN